MRLVVAAEEAAGVRLLRGLAERPHEVVRVLTSSPPAASPGPGPADVAAAWGLDTGPAERVMEASFADELRTLAVDLLLNVHSLFILPDAVLEAPRLGAYNLHPGPLPAYAGLDVVSWAILNGETRHGVTIHRMVSRVDAGPIAYEASFDLGAGDSALAVSARCARQGVALMLQLVDAAAAGDPIPAKEQDLALRRVYRHEVPSGGRLSWRASAAEVVRFVRACDFFPLASPWGHPTAWKDGREIGIVKAETSSRPTSAAPGSVRVTGGTDVEVSAADEWVTVRMVEWAGRLMDPFDVLQHGDALRDG